jgi:hypothetical protein
MYHKEISADGAEFIVKDFEDGSTSWIPCDQSNSDYQAYLKSLEEQAPKGK